MEIAVVLSIAGMFGSIGYILGRDIYKRLIQPFTCYKFVIFDMDDEYTFYEKKKHVVIKEKLKGFTLFKKKGVPDSGEFYTLPLDQAFGDVNDKYSKRDDRGFVTYYFYRNNTTPINIVPDQDISMVLNDAKSMNMILKSNIFDSSVNMEDDKKSKVNWLMIVIIGIIMLLLFVFQDKLAGLVG